MKQTWFCLLLAACGGGGGGFELESKRFHADRVSAETLTLDDERDGVTIVLESRPPGSSADTHITLRVALIWLKQAVPEKHTRLALGDGAIEVLPRAECLCSTQAGASALAEFSGYVRFERLDDQVISGDLELVWKGDLPAETGGALAFDTTLRANAIGFSTRR